MRKFSVFNRGQSQVDSINTVAEDLSPVSDALSRRHSVPAKNLVDVTRKLVEIKTHTQGKHMATYCKKPGS